MNTSETTGTGAGSTAGTATGHGIAIIGLAGSGKTVFLAALAQAMQDNDGHPYLEATGSEAVKTRLYVAELWNTVQLGKWPASTNMGTLRALTWTWHSAEDLSHTVWLPDCAGQDIRQIFEEGGADEHQRRLAADIFASGHVLVLFNLKELIDLHGTPGVVDKRVSAETAVSAAIRALSEAGRPFSVLLTQYDAYEALIRDQFGGDLLAAVKHYSMPLWRTVERCSPELLPVSSAETEDRFVNGAAGRFPAINAKPHPSVMGVARAVNARLLEERRLRDLKQQALREAEEKERKKKALSRRCAAAAFAVTAAVAIAGVAAFLLLWTPWVPGSPHPQWAHVIADVPDGVWVPAPGYILKDARDMSQGTVWVPGQARPNDPRVTAARTEGEWEVPPGYLLDGESAVWVPGQARPNDPRVTAAQTEGEWEVPPGYRLDGESAVERKAGETVAVDLGGDVKLELVWCPPGTFEMGSPAGEAGRFSDEPRHRVTLTKGFWLGKHEVTQGQWVAVMGDNPSHFKGAGNLPVEGVSWEDCQKFCKKLNARMPGGTGKFRLPSEAEWEYACRARTDTAFHYGDGLGATMANFDGSNPYGAAAKGEYRKKTVPVGWFRPNGWGLHDMHGNVQEWCEDRYGVYLSGDAIDPTGAASGASRVFRGGSWCYSARYCRSAYRYYYTPSYRYNGLGFRVARTQQ